jgi:hypothetical protein
LAEYLDNNEDGIVDNQQLIEILIKNKSALIMFYDSNENEKFFENEDNEIFLEKYQIQDLQDIETLPDALPYNTNSQQFDASLEEVLHLISSK